MNKLYITKLFLFLFVLSLATASGNAQIFHKNPEKQLFGKAHRKNKEAKVKEPRAVLKAKKKQEANNRRLVNSYEKSVRKSQKRSIDIQTPEVQARMKKNKKDTVVREKEKKKKVKSSSQKAGKKYK
jgi:hypothetical protein